MSDKIIQYTKNAYEDLENFYNYISEKLQEPKIAKRKLSELLSSIKDLSFMAESYHSYPLEPWFSKGVHYFTKGNNCIFYTFTDKVVTIHRILGATSNIPEHLNEIWT